ncbi:DinB family protein [Marinoscillum sp. MHG1-6]|uniref:DinB family protein n=1 Tax=Marinoscillum sp. MHG1-6 TaxID=2959627 RepID=UPI0021584490|nr:DinB family protein [Marinoscillum sp. MHG1-6]
MKRPLYFLILISLSMQFVNAQDLEPQSQFAKDFLPVWQASTRHLIAVAGAMPEELYDYQPNDSSKTFGDQIGHIAFTCLYLSNGFAADDWGDYKDPDTSEMTKEEVVDLLIRNLGEATRLICAMTEEASKEVVRGFGGVMVKRYIAVLFVQDHLCNHRAKANLYIRMNDITPPSYTYFK